MSKIRKIIITLLTFVSIFCLTLAGCSDSKIEFVNFEDETIEHDLNSIFDIRDYLEVYDTKGNVYLATAEVKDKNDQKLTPYLYQFMVEQDTYTITITIKDDEEILASRVLTVKGVNKTPPHIILLDMPEFGVYNTDILVPVKFDGKGATVKKELRVERYVTNKVNGEYVTTLDTQNAIVITDANFTNEGVIFNPKKPGNYKISIYAWDANKSIAEARTVTKNYAIKETADAWGEIEGFDTPDALASNYHYYSSKSEYEYNPLRGIGKLIYAKNDAGDYLDADGNILYKRVDQSQTENRIAFYKKANSQATDYTVLAYYQNLSDFYFYDSFDNLAYTKEGCVTIKEKDGTDYQFIYKNATIGEEWYQELTDNGEGANAVTKYGVIKAQASEHPSETGEKRFYLSSISKNNSFLRLFEGNNSTGWIENPKFDYLSIWVLVKPKDSNNKKQSISLYTNANFQKTTVSVGKWFEYKVSMTELRFANYYPYDILSSVTSRPKDVSSYITLSNDDYNGFDFYFDNISYAKGADVVVNSDGLLMGREFSVDIDNAGELTKDDFNFYIGKADDATGILQTSVNGSSGYDYSRFIANYPLLQGTYAYTPELENGVACRKYFIQAMLNEQGLEKNNGEQIYASKVISVNNVKVELSEGELGQEITINASLDGFNGVTYEYFVKKSADTDWTTLATNKFTPNVPTSYDVKVKTTVNNIVVEKVLTKDYTKEISLSVQYPTGYDKYVTNNDISVVAQLEGAQNMTVTVVDKDNNPIVISNNVVNFVYTGNYYITATCTYNGVNLTKTQEIEVVGDKEVKATLKVNGQEFDTNNPIILGDVISIDTFVNEQLTTDNVTYKVVKLDSNSAKNVEITTTATGFTANYVGTYNIWAYYTEHGVANSSSMIEIQVEVNDVEDARYVNTFSDSQSVWSSYAKSSSATGKRADTYYEGATWKSSFTDSKGETRYGVLVTKPQFDETASQYGGARLGIYLRSFEYKKNADMKKAGVETLVYGSPNSDSTNRMYATYNNEKWDYISIPVYFPKEDAQSTDRIKVTVLHKTQTIEVPYNTWFELKLDKPRMMGSFANIGAILDQFTTNYDDANPIFCLGVDDITAEENINQEVYIDSMSFQCYNEYENFDELYFYDTVNKKALSTIFIEDIEYEGDTASANVILKAKAGDKEVDTLKMKTKFMTWGGTFTATYYNANGVKLTVSGGYDLSQNDGIYEFRVTNVTKGTGYLIFCFSYVDEETNIEYRGYRMLTFGLVKKTTA